MNAISNGIITKASREWATRPADQRFLSLDEMQTFADAQRNHSRGVVVASRRINVSPSLNEEGKIDNELLITGPNGAAYKPTHFSFGQLSSLVGAPAGYLRKLPTPLVADALNYGLMTRDVEDVGVLLQKNGDSTVRAVTGPNYGRVWNNDIIRALRERFGDGVNGDFRVPGEFGREVVVNKSNTTLYASDRDMFVFLADEKNRIQIDDRRDGQPGALARGFFVWNSEVGSCTLGIATFLFDYVCMNRIVWGAKEYREIRVRHTASAPDKFVDEVAPAIERYAQSSESSIVKAIEHARSARLGDKVDDFLKTRFGVKMAEQLKAIHMDEEHRPIETLWDVTTAVTAKARDIKWQDERVDLERQGGAILDLAQ